ncbi:transcriptional regulator, ArsR family [Singulisphaera sp. GP187]|nr:transcriptional regulator, ArsR family [Singulisphaera sp. GP187]
MDSVFKALADCCSTVCTRRPGKHWGNFANTWIFVPWPASSERGKVELMADSRFVYVTYIRTTPEKLWRALLDPEFTRQYWFETWHESEWNPGAAWRLMIPDGRVGHSGEVLEVESQRRLVLSWRAEFNPELRAEGDSRVTFELEPQGESVKLTVVHEIDQPDSKLVKTLSNGWPHLLASLKSLLETGESLVETRRWPKGL